MLFKMSQDARAFFGNIVNYGGSHGSEDKNKMILFDPFYCCALIGMAAIELDPDETGLVDIVQGYPGSYRDSKAYIAGLLVATEAKRKAIDLSDPQIESVMLQYLSSEDETLLTDEGIKTINAYSRRGYILYQELFDKPQSREEFLAGVCRVIQTYGK